MVQRLTSISIRWRMLLLLEVMLRMAMRVHIPGSSRITILHSVVVMPMVIIVVAKRRSRRTLLMIIVTMHFGLHGIGMHSMMHRGLATIVHMIVLRALVLVLLTWISLVHRRTRMVTVLFRTSHVVILSAMRHWWRLAWVLLVWLGLKVVRLIRIFLSCPILGAILTAATNGDRYTRRNCHLWLLLLL